MPRRKTNRYKRPRPLPAASGQSTPELSAWWDEFWKARSVYPYADRIRRAGKFIADSAYIDEAIHLYNLPDFLASHFEKNFPDAIRPVQDEPGADDYNEQNAHDREILRYLRSSENGRKVTAT